MEKKRVSVQIEGRSYSLITTDDEKYVQKVANEVLSHIRKAAQSTKQLDTRDCAVLAALNFCDDRNKALKKNKDYVEKADKIIQQTNDLNRLCKEYREKLTEAMNDNTRLINNNKELEKRLAVLGHEVSQLKEKLESVDTPKEKYWWITGFNPYYQSPNIKMLKVTVRVRFDNPTMFMAFYNKHHRNPHWKFVPQWYTGVLEF